MNCPNLKNQIPLCAMLPLLLATVALAQSNGDGPERLAATRSRFTKAFVVDDRLSALRRDAHLQAEVVQRLRLGRPVLIIGSRTAASGQPAFYRVAVTRRTRGWIHGGALAVPGLKRDGERVLALVSTMSDEVDKIALCSLLVERFSGSAAVARAMLTLADEAHRAASSLTRRAQARLKRLDQSRLNAGLRDYYLNDPGLDRYSKLGVKFNFNETTGGYVYDGQAYRDVIRRFPKSEEAERARRQLALTRQ